MAALPLTPLAAQQTARPYALRDMRVGTPLADLRQLNFLDGEQRKKIRLLCSNDPEAEGLDVLHPFATGRPGTIRCALFERGNERVPKLAKFEVFAEKIEPILLCWRGKRDREIRLMQIVALFSNARFTQIIELMQRTYGPPSNYQLTTYETVFGPMTNGSYFWSNGVSSIQADYLTLDVERMSVVLSYDVK